MLKAEVSCLCNVYLRFGTNVLILLHSATFVIVRKELLYKKNIEDFFMFSEHLKVFLTICS